MNDLVAPLSLGVLSGLGSCALARAAALTSFAGIGTGVLIVPTLIAYAIGTVGGYAAYGLFAHAVFQAGAWSAWTYGLLAVVLAVGGIANLLREEHHEIAPRAHSLGAAALLGFGGSIILSPCCTPFVFALIAQAGDDGRRAVGLLAAFALGHVAPAATLVSFVGASGFRSGVSRRWIAFASGVTSLAMAGYYGLIA